MPRFGRSSEHHLRTTHPDLQRVLRAVVLEIDCKVLEGHRGEVRQNQYYRKVINGKRRSKVKWPNGQHNSYPSKAADVAPWPIDWNDTKRFYFFAGYVICKAASMGVTLRWGGDWDRDYDFGDQDFMDLVHFELVE